MANSILTIDMITREALRLWKNTNALMRNVEHQYDDSFAKEGAKIGDTLRIRLPNDYVVRTGPGLSVQDTSEQSTTLTVATQKGVDVSFSTAERTLKLDDYSRRVLAPMVNNLAGAVATDIMLGVEGGVSNFAANYDSVTGLVATPTSETWLDAGAILDDFSQTGSERMIVTSTRTNARTVSSLTGLFNSQVKISDQYRTGQMAADTLGFDWYKDQTIVTHTTATYTGGQGGGAANCCAEVSGAGQTGLSLTTSAITGGLNIGEIIYLEGVYSVNRITKQSTGRLAQFVVTANVATGGTSVPIYPAIVPPNGVNPVQYQTTDSSPANGADVFVVTLPAEVYRKNLALCAETLTVATADLVMPTRGVEEAARESFDGVAMRMLTAYIPNTDQLVTRLDVLFGYKWLRPEWGVAVGDRL